MRMRRYLVTMALRVLCFVLAVVFEGWLRWVFVAGAAVLPYICLLYTSDAADERSSVDLGGRRIIKKKKLDKHQRERMYEYK